MEKLSILDLLSKDEFIVYNKRLAHILGINETIFFMHLISKYRFYLKTGELQNDGSFYQTIESIKEETALTRAQQDLVISNLTKKGFIVVKKKGVPPKRFFIVNIDNICELFSSNSMCKKITNCDERPEDGIKLEDTENGFVRNLQLGEQETYSLNGKKVARIKDYNNNIYNKEREEENSLTHSFKNNFSKKNESNKSEIQKMAEIWKNEVGDFILNQEIKEELENVASSISLDKFQKIIDNFQEVLSFIDKNNLYTKVYSPRLSFNIKTFLQRNINSFFYDDIEDILNDIAVDKQQKELIQRYRRYIGEDKVQVDNQDQPKKDLKKPTKQQMDDIKAKLAKIKQGLTT